MPLSIWKLPCTKRLDLTGNLLTRFTGETPRHVSELHFLSCGGAGVSSWSGFDKVGGGVRETEGTARAMIAVGVAAALASSFKKLEDFQV